MKELVKSLPLALFLILLCTLSISVYFGNLTINQNAKNEIEGLETSNSTLSPTLVKDINKILNYIKTSDNPVATTTQPAATTTQPAATTQPTTYPDDWFKHWNEIANGSTDYVSKTQVFPNVCKNCSNQADVCTNCRGLGGNGTYKNRFSDFVASHGAGYRGQGNWTGFGGRDPNDPTLSKLADNTGKGLVDVTKTALNNATGLAAGVGLGAIGLVEDAGSGATDLLRDTGSGATDLLRDTASGAVGLAKDLGSGVKDVLKSNPLQINQTGGGDQKNQQGQGVGATNNPYQSGYYSQGTYNLPNNPLGIQGIDPYSYNGALISKGSNFIPITDDFSSFRK